MAFSVATMRLGQPVACLEGSAAVETDRMLRFPSRGRAGLVRATPALAAEPKPASVARAVLAAPVCPSAPAEEPHRARCPVAGPGNCAARAIPARTTAAASPTFALPTAVVVCPFPVPAPTGAATPAPAVVRASLAVPPEPVPVRRPVRCARLRIPSARPVCAPCAGTPPARFVAPRPRSAAAARPATCVRAVAWFVVAATRPRSVRLAEPPANRVAPAARVQAAPAATTRPASPKAPPARARRASAEQPGPTPDCAARASARAADRLVSRVAEPRAATASPVAATSVRHAGTPASSAVRVPTEPIGAAPVRCARPARPRPASASCAGRSGLLAAPAIPARPAVARRACASPRARPVPPAPATAAARTTDPAKPAAAPVATPASPAAQAPPCPPAVPAPTARSLARPARPGSAPRPALCVARPAVHAVREAFALIPARNACTTTARSAITVTCASCAGAPGNLVARLGRPAEMRAPLAVARSAAATAPA